MPERELVRDERFSAKPQDAPEQPAQTQEQAATSVTIPKWLIANRRGRRLVGR